MHTRRSRFISSNAAFSRNLCGGACVLKCERSEHAHKRHRVNCRSARPCYVHSLYQSSDIKSDT